MADTATVSFRTDPQVKQRAKELYASMGLDLSTALNMFLRQSSPITACRFARPERIR